MDDIRGSLNAVLELFGQEGVETRTFVLGGGRFGPGEDDVVESGALLTPRPIGILADEGEISIRSLPSLLLVLCFAAGY